ncbi:reverse transcriptase domain-containing protein [Tanacetum coccineum]
MPFGLKNVGATYQRLVDKAFDSQVSQNIKVYVDDLVIKSYTEAKMIRDIEEMFRILRKINMKLNPKKYTFEAAEGMFLGYMISPDGIKPCPNKTEAMPVYFVSRALQGLELNYTLMEKLVLSLVFTAKRLRRTVTKMERHVRGTQYHIPAKDVGERTDPSGLPYRSGIGLILTSPEGTEFTYALRFQFTASNNEADYKALIAGLRIAAQMGVCNVQVNIDSKLVANHILGTYIAKEENMVKYLEKAKILISGFANFSIRINIAGPFPEGPGKVKFFIVSMDYFMKWIEAKAKATITGNQVKKFVWDNIVCCFGLPREIISDNDKQFRDNPFKDWCEKLNIAQRFASVKHPQSNRLVERANRSLGEGIKARLGEGNKNWTEELPHVIWAHRIMIKFNHGDTLFSLTYGTEAVIPAKIRMPTYRTVAVDAVLNDEELRLNLDLLEEKRKCVAICEAKAKLKMTKYYNARVRGVTFRPGDFVYRSNDASHAVARGKLGPNWEGPYEVTEALGDGASRLKSMDGEVLLRTWNIANLKKCYL